MTATRGRCLTYKGKPPQGEDEMPKTRFQTALEKVDARQLEIERLIVADLELQFSDKEAAPEFQVFYAPHAEAETATQLGSPFTFSWFGIG
ncbi:MAG: hypothetical protein HKN07_11115 [Acidimicrobiia bacterium]|nr:hypothetical protein [Acidimicrobiia bacterium]